MPRFRTGRSPGRPLLGTEALTERVTGLVTPSMKRKILEQPEGESGVIRKALVRFFGGGRIKRPKRARSRVKSKRGRSPRYKDK